MCQGGLITKGTVDCVKVALFPHCACEQGGTAGIGYFA